jgi:sugar lactone lactonase YvrE
MKVLISLALLAAATAHGAVMNSTVTAGSVADKFPLINTMGPSIEGASVNRNGELYAVNKTHFLSLKTGNSDPKSPIIIGPGEKTSYFASSRFTRTQGVLVGDALGHAIWRQDYDNSVVNRRWNGRFHKRANTPLFINDKLLQPNDFTINGPETFLYMSGMNYTATTTAGEHGDIWWYCFKTGTSKQVPKDVLKAAGIHRCNGIELSPDDKYLYVTSAQNDNDTVISTKVFRFEVDPSSGEPKNPKVEVDLYQVLASAGVKAKELGMDPDGMRMDVEGNLFMTLNAIPGVLKWNTKVAGDGVYIPLGTVAAPSNLEFGGDDGKTLYVVGRCKDLTKACVDSYKHDKVGRAISNLRGQSPVPTPGSGTGTNNGPYQPSITAAYQPSTASYTNARP